MRLRRCCAGRPCTRPRCAGHLERLRFGNVDQFHGQRRAGDAFGANDLGAALLRPLVREWCGRAPPAASTVTRPLLNVSVNCCAAAGAASANDIARVRRMRRIDDAGPSITPGYSFRRIRMAAAWAVSLSRKRRSGRSYGRHGGVGQSPDTSATKRLARKRGRRRRTWPGWSLPGPAAGGWGPGSESTSRRRARACGAATRRAASVEHRKQVIDVAAVEFTRHVQRAPPPARRDTAPRSSRRLASMPAGTAGARAGLPPASRRGGCWRPLLRGGNDSSGRRCATV